MKVHIMLVDDDKDELIFFLDALKEVPCDDGYKCTYAGSLNQAAEMLKYLVPDFIFVDFKITGINEFQFLSAITDRPAFEKTKIYLYSIFSDETVTKTVMDLGVSGVVTKKHSKKELSSELKAVLTSPVMPAYVFSGGE
jgi:CheY-like chemotaxis protein